MLTTKQFEEIRQRAEQATPGPWEVDVPIETCECGGLSFEIVQDGIPYSPVVAESNTESDAEFIAHAREDIPKLLAEVERLNAKIKQMRSIAQEFDYYALLDEEDE